MFSFRKTRISVGVLAAAILVAGAVGGQEAPPKPTSELIDFCKDPGVSSDDLISALRPMLPATIEEIVQYWQTEVQKTLVAIADNSIDARKADADREALTTARSALESQKTAQLERFRIAYRAYRDKGGDHTAYSKWDDNVSGFQVDPSDAAGTTALLLDWAKREDGGIKWAKGIFFALLTLIIFRFLASIAGGVTSAGLKRTKLRLSEGLRRFFIGVVKKLVMILGVIMALSMLGVDIGPFVAAIGVGGFVLGFALQETLGNFAAGIMILVYHPFEIGHTVTAAGVTGKVEDISLVSTKFLTPDNQTIIVPNGKVWGGVITNTTGNATRRVDMVFGIGYDDDLAKAEKILTEIVTSHPKVQSEPAPTIKLNELADSSVNFIVRPWTATGDYWGVKYDVTRAVKERFDAEGISIPYPQRDVHMHTVT